MTAASVGYPNMAHKSRIAVAIAAGLALILVSMGVWYEPTSADQRKQFVKLLAIQVVLNKNDKLVDLTKESSLPNKTVPEILLELFPNCCKATYFIGGLSSKHRDFGFSDKVEFKILSIFNGEPYYVTVDFKINGEDVGATMIAYESGEIYQFSPL